MASVAQSDVRLPQPGANEISDDEDVDPKDNELDEPRTVLNGRKLEGEQTRKSEYDDPLGPRLAAIEQKTLECARGAIEPGEYRSAEHQGVRQVIADPVTRATKHRTSLGQLPCSLFQRTEGRSRRYRQPECDPNHQGGFAELVGDDEFESETLPLRRAFSMWLLGGRGWLCPGHNRPADALDARTYTIRYGNSRLRRPLKSNPRGCGYRFGGEGESIMGFGRGVLLWLLGVPIPVILLLAMCSHHG